MKQTGHGGCPKHWFDSLHYIWCSPNPNGLIQMKLHKKVQFLFHFLSFKYHTALKTNYKKKKNPERFQFFNFWEIHTVRNLHFLSKNSTLIGVKNSWKCCGFGLFSCWQLWFHEKNCQKKFGWKTRENVGILSKLNFWTKIWLFE